jgi:hypothetical protein
MSAEVPKLHRRVPLGDAAVAGDRPPAQAVIVIADPVAFLAPPRRKAEVRGAPALDERAMAFEAWSRFDYV